MTDSGGANASSDQESSGPKAGLVSAIVLVVVALVVASMVFLGGDDDADTDSETAVEQETTTAPKSTGAPPATELPPVTEDPPVSEALPVTEAPPAVELDFSVGDILDGGTVPVQFTCDGDNLAPEVTIEAIPDGVLTLAMIVDDPDAPTADPFVHWVVYNNPGNSAGFTDGDTAPTYGINDTGGIGWFGPCPPEGDPPHGYVFVLYGLDRELNLDAELDGREVFSAIEGAIVAQSSIAASYERPAS